MRVRCYGSIFDFHSKGAGSTPATRSIPPTSGTRNLSTKQIERVRLPPVGPCARNSADRVSGYEPESRGFESLRAYVNDSGLKTAKTKAEIIRTVVACSQLVVAIITLIIVLTK